MLIKSFATYAPAKVIAELEDGKEIEVFVLMDFRSGDVLVPDPDQYALVEDRFEEFVVGIDNYLARPKEIAIPSLPDGVIKRARTIYAEARNRQEEVCDVHKTIKEQERVVQEKVVED